MTFLELFSIRGWFDMNTGVLLLRLAVGLTLTAHGSQKLFGWFGGPGLNSTGQFFEERLGFRPGRRHALLAGLGEAGGGLLLALGLLTSLGAAAVILSWWLPFSASTSRRVSSC